MVRGAQEGGEGGEGRVHMGVTGVRMCVCVEIVYRYISTMSERQCLCLGDCIGGQLSAVDGNTGRC